MTFYHPSRSSFENTFLENFQKLRIFRKVQYEGIKHAQMIQNTPEMNVSQRVDVVKKKTHQKSLNSREDMTIFVNQNTDPELKGWCETSFFNVP